LQNQRQAAGFVSYQNVPAEQVLNSFYRAYLDSDQKVTDGSSIIFKLEENCMMHDTMLPAGTVLYGSTKFAKNRILVTIHVDRYLDQMKSQFTMIVRLGNMPIPKNYC